MDIILLGTGISLAILVLSIIGFLSDARAPIMYRLIAVMWIVPIYGYLQHDIIWLLKWLVE